MSETGYSEQGIVFSCEGKRMVGIVARPDGPILAGIVVVVGGPQYRVGSHRQFVLLARDLARRGIASLRFDYRGMGDSEGEARTFEDVSEDIAAAIDVLADACGLSSVVLWGLCDGASAALMYADKDKRVTGLVLLNPWVRTEYGEARTYLRHYYARRLLDPELWRRVLRGRFSWRNATCGLSANLRQAAQSGEGDARGSLPERMEAAMASFAGPVLIVLSGRDLTAREFEDAVDASPKWKMLITRSAVTKYRVVDAVHTFASRGHRDGVAARTAEWTLEIVTLGGQS